MADDEAACGRQCRNQAIQSKKFEFPSVSDMRHVRVLKKTVKEKGLLKTGKHRGTSS
jgi:hypothetical protein